MRNTKNAFTLVELIVVITILAVLGTIAFVSLQGYSRDAKNSKVTADIRTLVSAIETALTDSTVTMDGVVNNDTDRNSINGVSGAFGSGKTLANTVNYKVGTVNFVNIKQNGDDFRDSSAAKNPYVAAAAFSGSSAYYQVAGQTEEASGSKTAIIK